ncbi:MAG: sugar phosphate isomerase/epimerase, partial [Deltaproteobacteria bacterium]|nr:sugar phosphate isomerase/epimerase [Deltaproteobacteria bacterium]
GGRDEEDAWSELARENNLVLLAHGPNEGNPRDVEFLAENTLPKLKLALEEAGRMGVTILTIHFNVDTRWLPPETISGKIELLKQIAAWGTDAGVQVNIENLSETADDLKAALVEVPGLGLTLDTGHAMLTHPFSTAPEIIKQLSGYITHLHLHDNHGEDGVKGDLHLIPGEGEVDFIELFTLLKEKGYDQSATLELAPDEMAKGCQRVIDYWQEAPGAK